MILELVSQFGIASDVTHALYLPGSWPTHAANNQPAICGKRPMRGWELLNAGDREPSCDICLLILRGEIGRAMDVKRSRDIVVPPPRTSDSDDTPDEFDAHCATLGGVFSLRRLAVTL